MQARKAVRTMVSVVAAGVFRRTEPAADLAGKCVVTGVGLRQPRIRNQRPQAAPFRQWLRSFSLRYTKQRCGKLLVRNEKTSVCGAARKSPPEASDGLFSLFSYAVLPLQIVSFFMRVILTNL